MHDRNASEREIEERLARIESPEPPADLLDRIRNDIPDHLRPVRQREDAGTPRWGPRYRLLAASMLLAAIGGVVAYRVFQEAPEPSPVSARMQGQLEAPEAPLTTTEVGPEARPADLGVSRTEPTPPAEQPSPAQDRSEAPSPVEGETQLEKESQDRRNEHRAPGADDRRSAATVTTEVGPAAGADSEREARRDGLETGRRLDPRLENRLRDLGSVGDADRGARASDEATPEVGAVEHVIVASPRSQRAPLPSRRAKEIGVEPPRPVDPIPGPSTGGTAEPNDQPFGDMFFRPYGTNPFVDTEDDPQSTFGLDVDTGSYTLTRSYLERGHLPPREAIRVEEFINFFDYGDPAPRRGEFTMTAEGAPSPWPRGPRYQLLRIGIHGREISAARRKQATLTFVVDVSGSMARENRIELVRRALHLLLDQLGAGDRVGLVVYGSRGRVLLEPSGDLETVRRAVDRLATGGSTNAEEGLLLGYDLARRYFRLGAINRIVLCSDGVANVGRTGPESILERIGREAEEGIELTTVGFGMGNYNDVLMEQLADRGDGNYAYVDTLEEARRVFVENLTSTLQTIASDAKIQVEFDPRSVSRYRLLGYENRDIADHRFRDDSVDAGEIGAGHVVTALYELKLAEDAPRRGALGQVRLRYRSRANGRVVEDSLEIRRSQLARDWRSASPSLQLAAVAAELAEVLKGSYWAREANLEELRGRARGVERQLPGDPKVTELVDLVDRALRLLARTETDD